jgi:outer membrane receptor protein involved in Fe transport
MRIVFALALLLQAAAGRQVDVTVSDPQGLTIEGARVTVTEQQGTARKSTVTTTDGARFEGLGAGVYDVRIEAAGFATKNVTADLRSQNSAALKVQLDLATLSKERVDVVTRSEQQISDVPASATVVRAEEIKQSPAVVADDVLRQVPTFSLFRRTSSLAAHPTTQGVSLRGVGPSGVSRTLVLIDDVPFNDPFGGWVYWTRVPLASVERVEIVEGTNSSVYGNYALGGVINIVTAPPEGRTFKLRTSVAGRQTHKVEAFGASAWDKFSISGDATAFGTKGYYVVPVLEGGAALRGSIDAKAAVDYENGNLKLDWSPTDRISGFVRGGYFSEDRINAKSATTTGVIVPSELNNTIWKSVSTGVRIRMPGESTLEARAWGNFETFHSNNHGLTAPPSRNGSRLTLMQRVPTNDTGGMVQWSGSLGSKNFLTAGTDWRWVDGDSLEQAMNGTSTAVATNRTSGGTQISSGVYLQDIFSVTNRFQMTFSARLDHWRNYDAHNRNFSATTGLPLASDRPSCNEVADPTVTPCLADKKNTIGNPRVGAVYHLSDSVSVWSSLGWGFRAPTLNELYRQFAVGSTTTLANDQLGPERLTAGEGGVTYTKSNLTWRSAWFVNKFINPVSNVTTNVVGTTITRQRQNLGKTRIWGLQSEVEYRFQNYWRVSTAYVYDVAKVTEGRADFTGTSLVGKYLAEVPRHRGSMELSYSNPRLITAAASWQVVGGQYDDDLNSLWLPYYSLFDVNVSRKLYRNVDAFFGVQNLFNREFYVQRGPTTVGGPRLVTGGLEYTWNGR